MMGAPIIAADRAEEQSAAMSLRSTTTTDELVTVWHRDADHFAGEARERLQRVYAEQIRRRGALTP